MQSAVKKTLKHPKANENTRTSFQNKIKRYTGYGRPIVYLDESGFATDMPRKRGHSQKGTRCYGVHNWHEKGRINVIGALLGKLLLTASLFTGSINSDVFYAWLVKDLLPKLPAHSVIVMDNARFHKRSDMIEAIEEQGHTLEYLPSYSPDLNPIERKWAEAKAIRRKYHCSIEDLFLEHLHYVNL
ncbi:IS630 family transposase [Piscirickettsia salmonis]|uniref:IS630 family transposase n=1 Tax=Piscirickettsia salmonis TaxID=1238 RepID=UPI001E311B97|nr:IS630 family transposase [Piscirickettsia salmonis]